MSRVYATTFCNWGHDVITGMPVGHSCYQLSSVDLHIEMKFGANAVERSMLEYYDDELEAMDEEDTEALAAMYDARVEGIADPCPVMVAAEDGTSHPCSHRDGHPGDCA